MVTLVFPMFAESGEFCFFENRIQNSIIHRYMNREGLWLADRDS